LPEFIPRRIAVASAVGICALAWAAPVSAYRPFDGTDAAVADIGEVEIEFQPIGALRAGPTKGLSDAISAVALRPANAANATIICAACSAN
jgi:hypothetical protein